MITAQRDQRDAIADGVKVGYGEAQVSAKAWTGRIGRRPWSTEARRPGLTGAALEAAVDALALRFPNEVTTVH